jgi:hypothetical protein
MKIVNLLLRLGESKLDLTGGKQSQNLVCRVDVNIRDLVADELDAVVQRLLVCLRIYMRLFEEYEIYPLIEHLHIKFDSFGCVAAHTAYAVKYDNIAFPSFFEYLVEPLPIDLGSRVSLFGYPCGRIRGENVSFLPFYVLLLCRDSTIPVNTLHDTFLSVTLICVQVLVNGLMKIIYQIGYSRSFV